MEDSFDKCQVIALCISLWGNMQVALMNCQRGREFRRENRRLIGQFALQRIAINQFASGNLPSEFWTWAMGTPFLRKRGDGEWARKNCHRQGEVAVGPIFIRCGIGDNHFRFTDVFTMDGGLVD